MGMMPSAVSLSWLPPIGDLPTILTVWEMRRLANRIDPVVRDAAARVVSGIPGQNGTAQAQAIREFMEERVRFLRDPRGVELLYGVPVMLAMIDKDGTAAVDCDDAAILAASLGKAVGLKARFTLVGFFSPRAPFRHVWTDLRDPRGAAPWIDQDITRSAQGLPNSIRRVWHVGV